MSAVPQFAKVQDPDATRGTVVYESALAPDLAFYVFLQPDTRDDRFTVEIAWSRTGRYPFFAMPEVSPDAPPDGRGAFRIRLPRFWTTEPGIDFWWEIRPRPSLADLEREIRNFPAIATGKRPVSPEALARVDETAAEAVRRISEYALPFFVRVAHGFGHEWPGAAASRPA